MKADIRTISVKELKQRLTREPPLIVLDVRTPAEFCAGHVPGARNVPLGSPEFETLWQAGMAKGEPLAVLCQSGGRAAAACLKLVAAGRDVCSVEGGTSAWQSAGFPLEHSPSTRRTIALERQVRIAAGTIILAACALGWLVHPGFFALAAFVGAGLLFAGVTDFCGMGLLLARMPWNQS